MKWVGNLREWNNEEEDWNNEEEEWNNYIKHVNFFIEANDIEDECKNWAICLSVLRGLANNRAEEKTFDDLVELM